MGSQYIELSVSGINVTLVRFDSKEFVEVDAIAVSQKGEGVAAIKMNLAYGTVDITVSGTERFKNDLVGIVVTLVERIALEGIGIINSGFSFN